MWKASRTGLAHCCCVCLCACARQPVVCCGCGVLCVYRGEASCVPPPHRARERERAFVIPLAFSLPLFPPLSHLCSIPSLTHTSAVFIISLSFILFLLRSISASLSPTSFLACCPGCYQECRNIDVMSRGWKNRQIRFLLWFLRLLTSLHMRGWIVACCFSAEKKSLK